MTAALFLLAVAHLGAMPYVLTRKELPASKRQLALIFLLLLPAAGLVLALTTLRLEGRDGSPAFGEPEEEHIDRGAQRALLKDRAPLLDRLAGTPEQRQSALAELAKSGSAEAITSLRWTIEHGKGDSVIEAALTLEQLIAEGLSASAEAKKGLEMVSADELASSGIKVAKMIESGLIDSTLAPRLATVARDLFHASELKQGFLDAESALHWGRLELESMDPERGLEVVRRAAKCEDLKLAEAIETLKDDLVFANRCERSNA